MVQLVVDSGCDLPDEFLRKFAIPVLPHAISVGKDTFGDQRNPAQMSHFYTLSLVDRSRQIATGPATTEEIEAVLRKLVSRKHREIVVQTINRTNSPTFDNACVATSRLQDGDNMSDQVAIHNVDSRTVFSGQGLLALYTLSLIQKGLGGKEVRDKAVNFTRKIHCHAAIKDVYYIRNRARTKNESNISWLKAAAAHTLDLHPIISMHPDGSLVSETVRGFDQCIETMFQLATDKIQAGELVVPMVTVSIAGKLETLEKIPSFIQFEKMARERNVKVYRSVMSLSGGINLGPDTITLALATREA